MTFTFDPSVVNPVAIPFTGDTLNTKNYSVVQITSVTGSTANFTESGDLLLNNVTAGSNTFNPTGNLSAYTLYVSFSVNGV